MNPLPRALRLFFIATLVACLTPAHAQVPDHLACYRVKDAFGRASYTADVAGLAVHPGCTVKLPAKLLCVEAEKTNVTPPPPSTPAGMSPPRVACYKLTCPRGVLDPVAWNDQFGMRELRPMAPKMLCAPAVPTTTTTSTTLPPCLDPIEPTAARATEAFLLAVPPGQVLTVAASCGGTPAVCCPGGNPVQCDGLELSFLAADLVVTPTADPNRFTFAVAVAARTTSDIPVNVPLVGDCDLAIDTAAGTSATIQLSGEMLFDVHPATSGPDVTHVRLAQLTSPALEEEDATLGGSFSCQLANFGISAVTGLVEDTIKGGFDGKACLTCGATALGGCPFVP